MRCNEALRRECGTQGVAVQRFAQYEERGAYESAPLVKIR
jgi:hypothetical protein